MLRVTFEILPGGSEADARTIGVMEIANLRMHADGTADYAVVMKKCPPFRGALREAWRKGRVSAGPNDVAINDALTGEDEEMIVALAEGHHRIRRGCYDLLYRALVACGLSERNRNAR